MKATTIRLSDAAKRRLDRLRRRLARAGGGEWSQGEIVEDLVGFAERYEGLYFEYKRVPWKPHLTQKDLDRILAKVRDVDVETDVSRMDEALYGGTAP